MKTKLTREEIQERINELAEFKPRQISVSELKRIGCSPEHYGASPAEDRTAPEDPEDEDEPAYDTYEFRSIILKDRVNITQPPELSAINYAEVECEDCGNLCKNRQVEIKVCAKSQRPHKRTFCKTCQQGKNPWTGEFNLSKEIYSKAWAAWERENPDGKTHADSTFAAYKQKQTK